MNRRVSVVYLLLFFILACAGARGQSHLTRRLLTIPVEINNVEGAFLIDTGSNATIIDSEFAQRLGLKPSGTASVERNYSTEESVTVTARKVRIGPKLWSDVPLVMQDLSAISKMQVASISGIVGTDFLATMRVKLSYSSGIAQVTTSVDDGASPVALRRGKIDILFRSGSAHRPFRCFSTRVQI